MPIIAISTDRGSELVRVKVTSETENLGDKIIKTVKAAEEAQLKELDLIENGETLTCVNCGHTDTLKPLDAGPDYPLMFGSAWTFCTSPKCGRPWDVTREELEEDDDEVPIVED